MGIDRTPPSNSSSASSLAIVNESALTSSGTPSSTTNDGNLDFGVWNATASGVDGTWTWNKTTKQFICAWNNGCTDRVRVEQFDERRVVLVGTNHIGGNVRFEGVRNGNSFKGSGRS